MFCGEKSVHTNILLFLKNINEAVDEDFFFTITVFFTGFSKAVDGVTILKKIFKLIPKSADVILDGWKLEALRDCMRNRKQLVHLVHPKNVNFKALNVSIGFPRSLLLGSLLFCFFAKVFDRFLSSLNYSFLLIIPKYSRSTFVSAKHGMI